MDFIVSEGEMHTSSSRQQMPVAQPLFPSSILSVVPTIIEMLDDVQVDTNGISGSNYLFIYCSQYCFSFLSIHMDKEHHCDFRHASPMQPVPFRTPTNIYHQKNRRLSTHIYFITSMHRITSICILYCLSFGICGRKQKKGRYRLAVRILSSKTCSVSCFPPSIVCDRGFRFL